MISVLTLTYKRKHLLEEAIESFLRQDLDIDCEMVIINDNPDVDYVYNYSKIRVINCKERFPSISAKLEWGYKQCKGEYIYRLDDDDLLAPNALINVESDINNFPGYEIYRSKGMYYYLNNEFQALTSSVNNGNVYTKAYLNRITWPDTSGDEDSKITFDHNAKIYTSTLNPTMIYRWGMNTLHISGLGKVSNETILNQADKVLNNTKGVIELHPKFLNSYYSQIT